MSDENAAKAPDESSSSGGCAGAIVANLLAFALAFIFGFLFGASPPMHPQGAAANAAGIEGGMSAVAGLIFVYFKSFGIVPILISVVGASVGGTKKANAMLFGDADDRGDSEA